MTTFDERQLRWPLSKIELESFYCGELMNTEEIARLFSVTSGTVSFYRKKYGIRKVEKWERLRLPDRLNELETETILGYLLGDGYVGKSCKVPHLRVSQSLAQRDFVDQMYGLIRRWAAYEIVVDKRFDKRSEKIYTTCRFDTYSHPAIHPIYQLCYPHGKKEVTSGWLEKINGLGLALWYQGDGHLESRVTPVLNTNSFSNKECELIVSWFRDRYDIDAYVTIVSDYCKIRIIDGDKFRMLIEPYLIPHFRYKLPDKRKRAHRFVIRNKNGTK